VRRARAIVTHAGVGSVMLALANGKRPIVMARRRSCGEAVDDHQVDLAARLEAAGLVEVVEDSRRLLECLSGTARPPAFDSRDPWLGASLGTYLASRLGEPVAQRYE
jgi:UDP-N-acetylglucosamine transferase subunit ALG13